MTTKSIMEEAIQTGEILTIIYHGGSQPGKERQITPIQINDDRLRARCYSSNAVKVFMLDKIELATTQNEKPTIQNQWKRITNLSTDSFYEYAKDELEELGWFVMLWENALTLHVHTKTGLPHREPVLGIAYEKPTQQEIDESRATPRPWKLWGPSLNTAYTKPEKAFTSLMTRAEQHAPNASEQVIC